MAKTDGDLSAIRPHQLQFVSQSSRMARGWFAEKLTVLSTELRRALVTYVETHGRGIGILVQQAPTRFVQPNAFLILVRAEFCQPAEMSMKRRHAHAGFRRKKFDWQWFGKAFS